jgi:hypothetical protein
MRTDGHEVSAKITSVPAELSAHSTRRQQHLMSVGTPPPPPVGFPHSPGAHLVCGLTPCYSRG